MNNLKQVLTIIAKASSRKYASGLPKIVKSMLLLISLKWWTLLEHMFPWTLLEHVFPISRFKMTPDIPFSTFAMRIQNISIEGAFKHKIQQNSTTYPCGSDRWTVVYILKHNFSSARFKSSESDCSALRHNPIVVFSQFRVHHRIHPLLAVTVSWRTQFQTNRVV